MVVATTQLLQLRPAQPLASASPRRRLVAALPPARSASASAAAAPSAARRPLLLPPPLDQQQPHHQPWAAAAVGCLAALLLAASPASVEAKDVIQGVPKVVDGDTLDFSGTRVRLFGIDAPETKQSCTAARGGPYLCGEKSKQALLAKIGNAKVECEQKNRDKYGRVVGVCFLGKEDLNAWMVDQGLAVAYRQYSKAYVPLEDAARAAGRGIWNGTFELPAQWRKDNPRGSGGGSGAAAAPAVAAAPAAAAAVAAKPVSSAPGGAAPPSANCQIKGNINAQGERIYHVPGGAYYERTVIELDKGERYFCSAAEAEKAGWRAASS